MSSSSVVGCLVSPVDSLEHSSSAIVANAIKASHSSSAIIAQAVKGTQVLKIEGYCLTKGLANGSFIKSEPFDIGGHIWHLRYYPDSNYPENSGSVAFFLHLNQTYEAPVEASMNLSLLDNIGEPVPSYCFSGDITYTFKSTDNGWGYAKLITRKALEESTYLKDDCFSVRCDVTVSMEIRMEDSSQLMTMPPPSDMNQHIGRLLSSGVEADVTFQVGEETFAAHRLVLGSRSTVFMAELFGPMKEKGTSHIKINDMEARVFKAMLHFIYTDELPEMDKADTYVMAQHLLVAADRYDLQRLKLLCEHKLSCCINTGMVTTTLVFAEQHGCKGLKEACFRFLKSPGNMKVIMNGDGFQHLTTSCPSLLTELLASVSL